MKKGTVIYPYEPWTITETSYDPKHNRRSETVFTVANGYIGMRGTFEEGPEEGVPSLNGTYLNGFYDTTPIIYGEEAYGYAKDHQTMLNVTDSKIIQLQIDGQTFQMHKGKVHRYFRQLDMKKGIMIRQVEWETDSGKRVEIRSTRMASFVSKHLAMIRYEVKPLNFSGEVKLISSLNGAVTNEESKGDPRAGSAFQGQVLLTRGLHENDTFGAVHQQTKVTGFELVCGMDHQLSGTYTMDTKQGEQHIDKIFTLSVKENETVMLDKFISYHTSLDHSAERLTELAKAEVEKAKAKGFDWYAERQAEELAQFWQTADVHIEGDEALQQGLRFNAFHLFQSVGRDGRTNIAAKGLTGEGYGGHYFWDTETYNLPFFLYNQPEIARKLLEYRSYILPKARERAEELAHKGALYPWRTINGEEASAYFPAGTAQYHINTDIAYAVRKYMEATHDDDFLIEHGIGILIETSRFFADLGEFIEGKGFCINGVTGPDEYTAIVNNNTYTNIMVKDQLEFTLAMVQSLQWGHPAQWNEIHSQFGVDSQELETWRRMADEMYIHRENGLIGQDDSFLQKSAWDFEGTPADKYPLLLHYHPLNIYRHQVLKQADLVLAFYLQHDRFSRTDKVRNYHYYEKLCTHDSSLSASIHGIVAADLGDMEKSYDYFMQSVRMDLDDYHHNVKDGVHTASMAGSWLGIVGGFAGMRHDGEKVSFEPKIPGNWKSYTFRIRLSGRMLELKVTDQSTVYSLLEGEPLQVIHYGAAFQLSGRQELRNHKLAAVIFDLDGVITDTAEYHYLAWKELADELGIPFDREYNEKLKGVDRLASLQLILDRAGKELPEEEKLALATSKNERYKKLIQQVTPDDLLPGVKELLAELREKGIKVGLASASKNAGAVIRSLQVEAYFDHIVDAAAVEISKPDPEVFLKAAEALGVHPAHCIGVEDAEAGVEAILLAGMTPLGIGDPKLLGRAKKVVGSLEGMDVEKLSTLIS
ncbi:beta-phosphoglucomutase [Marinicrinis lubricantis]|uniref:Beta-phosphoglucomutase n=1 Tax=Marinicrinis lubricantis TaxID=2086470 RepID=A0ABW1IS70_9BACL